MLAETGFWICLVLVVYVYVGYPACVFLLALIYNRGVLKDDSQPRVTVVVAAFNEEDEIEKTVLNKLYQDYPPDKLDVIVISDKSTDRTDAIVGRLVERSNGRVRLLQQERRQGKTQALNLALLHASSDIVVFADANSIYAANAVCALVRGFADPTVGYITGKMIYTNPSASGIGEGSGRYISYENLLRSLETRVGSIVGVDGGIDAIRRDLYQAMLPEQQPDFVLPLSIVERGLRVVYEPDAIVYEPALARARDEFAMRVRVSLRALWAIYDKRRLLNPLRYGLFAWQLASHKIFRYGAFVPMLGLTFFNALLIGDHVGYVYFLLGQLTVCGFAALGHMLRESTRCWSKLLVPYYFVVLNAACILASWKFLNGQKMVLWTPRQGGMTRGGD